MGIYKDRQYSSARRVAVLSYGAHRAMLMLRLYLDDAGKSGDPNNEICCIAGCLSPLTAWDELEAEWKDILEKYEVPYLHMKELAHFKGPFSKWENDEKSRKEFLSSLMDVMHKYVLAIVGATIPIEAYNSLSEEQRNSVPDPYFMCFQQTLHLASSRAFAASTETKAAHGLQTPNPNQAEKFEVIFSEQDDFKGRANQLFKHMKEKSSLGPLLGAFTWASYKEVIPLQAADLVAYEVKIFARDLLKLHATPTRVPMKRLFTMSPIFSFLDHNEIKRKFYFGGAAFQG